VTGGRGLLCLLVLLLPSSEAQQRHNQFRVVSPTALTFEAGRNVPACAKAAVLRENPANGASVAVAKWPAGCTVPKHWHTPNVELIMISGKMRLETEGNKVLQAGDYVFLPSRHHHQFPCATACVFYLMTDGPFDIHYVDSDGNEIPAEQALRRPAKP
jgi:quercetin dioxygenase-like cupin family protein